MSKPQERERSTLTNDQYKQLKEAYAILSELSTECDILRKGLDASLLSQDEVWETITTKLAKQYDRYIELVHDVELSKGTSVYFMGFEEIHYKDVQLQEAIHRLLH